MPSCQKHLQYYNQDEYCVYCGIPFISTGVSTNTNPIINPIPCDHFFEALADGPEFYYRSSCCGAPVKLKDFDDELPDRPICTACDCECEAIKD